MLHNNSGSEGMPKARKLHILVAISMPLAISSIVLSLVAGYMASAIVRSAAFVGWTALALGLARKSVTVPKTPNMLGTPRITRNKLTRRFLTAVSLSLLLAGVIGLPLGIFYGLSLHFALYLVWLVIVNGSEFFFVRVLTDELVLRK